MTSDGAEPGPGGPTDAGGADSAGGVDAGVGDAGVRLAFDEQDLLPAVAQDAETGEVLMLAYVSEAALDRTRETGRAHYYSRSREELWEKGATSGHTQAVREIRVDCDGDALLYLVDQTGGACHTGYRSCFHRTEDGEIVGERVFDPEAVYDDV